MLDLPCQNRTVVKFNILSISSCKDGNFKCYHCRINNLLIQFNSFCVFEKDEFKIFPWKLNLKKYGCLCAT